MYDVAHGRTAVQFAQQALNRHKAQGAGALELDFEGSGVGGDANMKAYITATVAEIRKTKPLLPVRINVTPYKGGFVPVDLINFDDKLALAVQCYGGNMDALFAAEDVVWEAVAWGVNRDKVTAMHAVMCSQTVGGTREVTLPSVRNRGAFYIDDLLLDAGLLPS